MHDHVDGSEVPGAGQAVAGHAVGGQAVAGQDVQASFCAAIVDEWLRCGAAHAVISPGSRSTPLALALAESRLDVHVVLDERSAGFVALGLARATGRPAVVLCTSGTAAAELHAAIVEADLDGVAMLVCTADRPPELHTVGAPQTVDQQHLYGRSVRWFYDPGVAAMETRPAWRSIAARAFGEATLGPRGPGPVHLNLAFREPLIGAATVVPIGRADGAPWHVGIAAGGLVADSGALEDIRRALVGRRGVIVAGAGAGEPAAVHRLAAALDWPVLADPRSGCRVPGGATVSAPDAMLRDAEVAARLAPEVVLRLGAPFASKVVGEWLARAPVDVLVSPHGRWLDPKRSATHVVAAEPGEFCRVLVALGVDAALPDWKGLWRAAENAARTALSAALDGDAALDGAPTEPAAARALLASLPDGALLVASSSMPIRDLEWYGEPRRDVRVVANRGANGIDGVTSTILGVAASHEGPTVGVLGDLAFLHDVGGLVTAVAGRVDVTIVVIDNNGGGIFEFLPQRSTLPRDRFEQLFGTPQALDVVSVTGGFGIRVAEVTTVRELTTEVGAAIGRRGCDVVVLRCDRSVNVALHDELHRAVRDAVVAALPGPR